MRIALSGCQPESPANDYSSHTPQKMKLVSRISSVNVTKSKLVRIWSHLLKKSLMENFSFRVVSGFTLPRPSPFLRILELKNWGGIHSKFLESTVLFMWRTWNWASCFENMVLIIYITLDWWRVVRWHFTEQNKINAQWVAS